MDRDGQRLGGISSAANELDESQTLVLEKAVDKLVCLGELVGVTPEEMIRLLDSGFTVRELLDYIASRRPPCSKCRSVGEK
jgi:hypothetical protein